MYIVLTGDLKSSKKIENREVSQERLKDTIMHINSKFSEFLVSDFRIIGGDGFQGMIWKLDSLFDIYFSLLEHIQHPFYLGVGIGTISTSLSDYVQEIDGEAFHFSSNALKVAKRKKRWMVLESDLENNDVVECILNFIWELVWNWTPRQCEIILFYRKHGENREAIELAAKEFETGSRNIYKTLETGKYSLIKYGEETLEKEFQKIQDEINKVPDR